MDKRSIVAMVLLVTLSLAWLQLFQPWLCRKMQWNCGNEQSAVPASSSSQSPATNSSAATTRAASPSTTPATTNAIAIATPVPSSQNLTTAPASVPSGAGVNTVKGSIATQPVIIGSIRYEENPKKPRSPYPLGIAINNRGAALDSVTLNRFRSDADKPEPYVFQKPYEVSSPLAAALATRSISINGAPPIALDGIYWIPGPATENSATFSVDINDQVRVTKIFEIRDSNDVTAGYEALVRYALQNLTNKPLTARLSFNGTNSPKPENNRDMPEIVAGFDGGSKTVELQHSPVASVKPDNALDIRALVRPTDAANNPLELMTAKGLVLNAAEQDVTKRDVAIDSETPELILPANGSSAFTLNVYLGPKSRDILKSAYYSHYPLGFDQTLVLRSGWTICAACTWNWLIEILVKMLRAFYFVLHDWGLAIIALVCIVRLILHPVTKRSQISMSRMTKMGPEMERLKKKYGDDSEGFKKAQVEFYREQGVAPFLGCLPMFLQMPIWIALWSSLQSTFEIRHAAFLKFGHVHLTWINDLSQPDRLFSLQHPIEFSLPLIGHISIQAFNLLPILMAVVFYFQQKFTPQPVAATPEQRQQQKMMKWMSIFLFPLFLYGQPSGLNLYIFTSTLIGIIESKRVRDHIKEREEREKQGVVIVDADPNDDRPTSPARRPKDVAPAKPAGGIAGFMAKLQNMAEDDRKEQEKRAKKGKR